MRDEDLRVLLEHRRYDDCRNILLDRIEGLQRVRAQVKIDLSHRQQDAIVDLGTAWNDGDIEPVSAVGAVRQRLIESAVFGLRDPVGSKRHLVERLPDGSMAGEHVAGHRTGDYETRSRESSGSSAEDGRPEHASRKSDVFHWFFSERVR